MRNLCEIRARLVRNFIIRAEFERNSSEIWAKFERNSSNHWAKSNRNPGSSEQSNRLLKTKFELFVIKLIISQKKTSKPNWNKITIYNSNSGYCVPLPFTTVPNISHFGLILLTGFLNQIHKSNAFTAKKINIIRIGKKKVISPDESIFASGNQFFFIFLIKSFHNPTGLCN